MALTDKLTDIGNAIRSKTGKTAKLTLAQMPAEIESIQGADLSGVTATAGDVLVRKQFIDSSGNLVPGTMPNHRNYDEHIEITDFDDFGQEGTEHGLILDEGYYDGVTTAVSIRIQDKEVSPTESEQMIRPDDGKVLRQVKVNPISSTYVGSAVPKVSAKTVTPTKSTQTAVASGRYTTGDVKVGPIPSNYIIPSGSQNITSNDTYDVTNLAEVVVNVAGGGGSDPVDIDLVALLTNGTLPANYSPNVKCISLNDVNIKLPNGAVTTIYQGTGVMIGYNTEALYPEISIVDTEAVMYYFFYGTLPVPIISTEYGFAYVATSSSTSPYGELNITKNGTYDVADYASAVVNIAGGLPSGFTAIATGTFNLSSDSAGGVSFTILHNLGVTPDMFLFYAPKNVASTYSMLYAFRSSEFGWRSSSYLNLCGYHGNSTTTVTATNVTTSYGVKTLTSTAATITTYSTSTSYYWRAGSYKWIAIKF